jgi:hypothetical protein
MRARKLAPWSSLLALLGCSHSNASSTAERFDASMDGTESADATPLTSPDSESDASAESGGGAATDSGVWTDGAPSLEAGVVSTAFPLKISANGRYLVDQNGTPFRIHGYALWSLISAVATVGDLSKLLDALRAIGVNTLYVMLSDHDSDVALGRAAGGGPMNSAGAFPFTKNTMGGAYTGTGYTGSTYGGYSAGSMAGTQYANIATTNSSYFTWVDTVLDQALSAGILIMLFPAYLGYGGGDQGWAADLTASGASKVTAFGQFLGSRYKNQGNIIWMAYGDCDPGSISGMDPLLVNLLTAIKSVGAQQLWGGHLPKGNGSPFADPSVGPYLNLNSVYAWTSTSSDDSPVYALTLQASQATPVTPAFFFDDAAYEYDPYSTNNSPTAVRKREWWGLLSGTAGVTFGNEYMSSGGSTGSSSTTGTFAAMTTPGALYGGSTGLPTDGHKHFGVMAQIMNPLPWWLLLPANVGGNGGLVTSGGGTLGGQDWVAAAADPGGSLLVAYVPPAHSGSLSIAGTAMSRSFTAYWIDPTTAGRTTIGTHLSGAQTFSPTGNNAYGAADWVLLLQAE